MTAGSLAAHERSCEGPRRAKDVCEICSADGPLIAFDEDFDLCAECEGTCKWCFPYRSAKSLVDECAVNEAYRKWFMSCTGVRLGRSEASAGLKVATVAHSTCTGDRTERRFIGLSRTEFHDIFKVFPENIGLRMQNLEDEFGKSYRGCLIVDHTSPWRYHIVSRSNAHHKSAEDMSSKNQVYAEQADKTFTWAKNADEKKWQGQMSKAWAFTELRAKAESYLQQEAKGGGGGSAGSAAGDDEASARAAGVGASSVAELREADIISMVTTTPENKKWRTIKVLPSEDDNHQKLTNYWLSKLGLVAAMAGTALGKEKNECMSAADRLAAVEAHGFASQLREHHALVVVAEKLTAISGVPEDMGFASGREAHVCFDESRRYEAPGALFFPLFFYGLIFAYMFY